MLISVVWLLMLLAALVCNCIVPGPQHMSVSLLNGAQNGVELVLAMSGSLCLWSGFSRLCEKSGLSAAFSHMLHPILRRLFPATSGNSRRFEYICENLTANLLGLGNAATPSGIRAVKAMRDPLHPERATDEMCLFVVLNTASLQLLPSTLAALRAGLGSRQPLDLLPVIWLCSGLSVLAGVAGARLFSKRWRE